MKTVFKHLMRANIMLAMLTAFFLLPLIAFAQEASPIVPPTAADFEKFLEVLGGVKTLGTMGIVSACVQAFMLLLRSGVGELAGKYRLILLSFATMIAGFFALRATGLDVASSLLHSTTLLAVQNCLHQFYKQFMVKET